MYLVSIFLENYGNVEIESVKKAVKLCNEDFLCRYRGNVDCRQVFFNEDATIKESGGEMVDFWDAYKDYYDECPDMNDLPVVVAARKVMEIRGIREKI